MSEKTDLLNELGALATKLNREPPINGTLAELRGWCKEWAAEVAVLDEDGDDDGSDVTGSAITTPAAVSVTETPMLTETTENTGSGHVGEATNMTTVSMPEEPAAPVPRNRDDELVRFTALVTLHVNAVDDSGKKQPVVVAGKRARIPQKLFTDLQRSKLVKRV